MSEYLDCTCAPYDGRVLRDIYCPVHSLGTRQEHIPLTSQPWQASTYGEVRVGDTVMYDSEVFFVEEIRDSDGLCRLTLSDVDGEEVVLIQKIDDRTLRRSI